MEKEIKLDDHITKKGTYKGVNFVVSKWRRNEESKYMWNYYLFVTPRNVEKYEEESVNYYDMYSDVDMHGGITYWVKCKDNNLREFDKIGCDYGHSFDVPGTMNWDSVLEDVKETIDNLPSDLSPNYKNENYE